MLFHPCLCIFRFIQFYCLILFTNSVLGQTAYILSFSNEDYNKTIKNIKTSFKTELELRNYLKQLQYSAYKKGYLLASFDSILSLDSTHYNAHFVLGERFQSILLRLDDRELFFIKKRSHISEKVLANIPLSPVEFTKFMQSIQRIYINDGYPFVSVYLDSIHLSTNSISAVLQIDRGIQMHWKQLHLRGDTVVSEKVLANMINIKPKQRYNESTFEQLSIQIQNIHFIEEIQPAQLLFTPQGVDLYTYLKKVPANSLNGIIGFQPKSQTAQLSLTGELSLKLQNILKHAEKIEIEWHGLGDQTQNLNAKFSYPYIFNTSFGLGALFDLRKIDSTFLNIKTQLSIDYYFSFNHFISAFYQTNTSNLLYGSSSSTISNLRSTRINSYGLLLSSTNIDYLPNPTRGWSISLNCSVGIRTSSSTDSTSSEKNTIFRSEFELSKFFLLSKRLVFLIRNQSNLYYAPTIYSNEAYRYGGLKVQRGFDEQELHATAQTTFSAECRFLMDKKSFVFIFFDQSWYENNSQKYYQDKPYGFGAGLSFGTNIGFFSLTYALGQQFNNPLELRNGKIHFGYISYF